MKMRGSFLLLFGAAALAVAATLTACGGRGPEITAPEWETHVYRNEEMGFALSFATPADWLPTGPIGERKIGGWYEPKYPLPPSPAAVWCYRITSSPPHPEPHDPIMLTSGQKRVATRRVQGNWSYHLMCVAPAETFAQHAPVFDRIMASFKPLASVTQ